LPETTRWIEVAEPDPLSTVTFGGERELCLRGLEKPAHREFGVGLLDLGQYR